MAKKSLPKNVSTLAATAKKKLGGLPPALAKNAAAASLAKVERLREEALGAIALVKRKQSQVAEAFYEMGQALAILKRKEVVAALGRTSFEEICKRDLSMSHTLANQLVDVAARYTVDQALSLGQSRAIALLDLVAATPEDDTPTELLEGGVRLPDGTKLRPKNASAIEMTRAAKAVRRATAAALKTKVKGRTVSAEDAAIGERVADVLTAASLSQVKVRAIAGLPGRAATFRFEGVTADTLAAFAKALARLKV